MLTLKILIPLVVIAIALIAVGGTLMLMRRKKEKKDLPY